MIKQKVAMKSSEMETRSNLHSIAVFTAIKHRKMFPRLRRGNILIPIWCKNRYNFWQWSIVLTLIALHLCLLWREGDNDLWSASCLFWSATLFLLWRKRRMLKLNAKSSDRTQKNNLFILNKTLPVQDIEHSAIPGHPENGNNPNSLGYFAGFLLMAWILYKSLHTFEEDVFLRLFPLFAMLSFSLITTGLSRLRQYAPLFLLLSFLAIPWELLYLFNITQLTTQFATALLQLAGFTVQRQGFLIFLPGGSIEVYNGCSGIKLMTQLVGIAWIYLSLMRTTWRWRGLVVTSAIVLGFVINGLRVALMAILAGYSRYEALDYWHHGDGSLLFPLAAVLILGVVFSLTQNSLDSTLDPNP